jgi:hypothetical protein
MKRLRTSFIAWSFFASTAAFPALLYALPYDRFLDLALAIAFGVSFAGTIKYGRSAILAAKSGKSGAEFLIVAMFAMFTILLGQRIWGILLRVLDRPDWLVNSPITIMVPWYLSWAMALAIFAPDIDLDHEDAKSRIWKSIALFIGGALAGFVVAASFGVKGSLEVSKVSAWPGLTNRASCAAGEPVWVSSNGVYHDENSPYRAQVIPRWCFQTVEEAKKRGFRGMKMDSAASK